jgi:hypothetical protein
VKVPWKLLGLASLAGVAAGGAMVARNRRAHQEYDSEELRAKLHSRLAEVAASDGDADAASQPR